MSFLDGKSLVPPQGAAFIRNQTFFWIWRRIIAQIINRELAAGF